MKTAQNYTTNPSPIRHCFPRISALTFLYIFFGFQQTSYHGADDEKFLSRLVQTYVFFQLTEFLIEQPWRGVGHLVPLEEAAQVTDTLPFQQLVPIRVKVAVVSRSRHQDSAVHLERLLPFLYRVNWYQCISVLRLMLLQ